MKRVSRTRSRIEDAYAEILWRRCREDKVFFFNQLYIPSVRDARGREEWRLYDYQYNDQVILNESSKVVILKARQLGLSTLVAGNVMHDAMFRPGSVSLWVSNNQDNANKAVAMIDTMWRFMPFWMKDRAPKMDKDQAGSKQWVFDDGSKSRIRAYAGTGTAGASETATKVILDEFALVEDQDNLYRSVGSTIDAGLELGLSALWIISTARGGSNLFARIFNQALDQRNTFEWIFHPWMESRFINPKAELKRFCEACGGTGFAPSDKDHRYCDVCVTTRVYDQKVAELIDRPWLVPAEYPSEVAEAFRESGRPRFRFLPTESECEDDWVRVDLSLDLHGRWRWERDEDAPLRIRRDMLDVPDYRQFVLYADPARGEGGDAYAAHVVGFGPDATPEVVAWWHHNMIEQSVAAEHMDLIGRFFNNALLAVERSGGYGDTSIHILQDECEYPNLYIHTPANTRSKRKSNQLGFPVHRHNRTPMIDLLAMHVTTKNGGPLLDGISKELRRELATFVRHDNGQVAADVGAHDDMVMSIAGALTVLVNEMSATVRPKEEVTPEGKPAIRVQVEEIYEAVDRREAIAQVREHKTQARNIRRARMVEARRKRRERIR